MLLLPLPSETPASSSLPVPDPWSLAPPCPEAGSNRIHPQLSPQIKRRASEALPELLRPVTPITTFEGRQSQDHSGIFGLVTNLEELEVDDWEF